VDDPTHLMSGFLGDSPRRSVEESARREHLILVRIKGELYPCAGAPSGLVGSGDSSIPRENIAVFLAPLL
jgi:hypothetical protein